MSLTILEMLVSYGQMLMFIMLTEELELPCWVREHTEKGGKESMLFWIRVHTVHTGRMAIGHTLPSLSRKQQYRREGSS